MESTDKETFEKLQIVATNIWNSAFTFEHSEPAENNSNPLVFTSASQRINQRFGALVSSTCAGPNQDLHGTLRRLYGYLYRCPVISCLRHHNGFETAVARDDHISKVNREFKCTVSSCDFASIGFPTEQELRRHHATFHSRLDSNDPIQATWRDMDQTSCVRILYTAAKAAEPSLVRSLLSLALREQFAIDYLDLWKAAASGGSIEVFRSVLDSSPSKEHNKDNRIVALRAAMNCEHLDLVRMMLVDQRFELVHKQRRFSALCHAVERGQEEMLKLLLATRDDIDVNSSDNKWSRKPLFWAIANGHEAVVSLLLTRDDVDPNSKDKDGWTPLAWAAQEGHDAVVELLLTRDDVDPNSKDNEGCTPLAWAAHKGHEAVAKLLLARDDVDANSKDNEGWTPLTWTAQEGHDAVVKLLLARDDVDAHSKNDDGQTPLSIVAKNGHEAVVKLLR